MMLAFLYTAALFGLRARRERSPQEQLWLHQIYVELGCPPVPMTAKCRKRGEP